MGADLEQFKSADTLNRENGVCDMKQIISFDELVVSIPARFEVDSEHISDLKRRYDDEVESLNAYAQKFDNVDIKFYGFDEEMDSQRRQTKAFFCVKNLDLPVEDQMNWFGQNTSQWEYAGAIVLSRITDERTSISSHH